MTLKPPNFFGKMPCCPCRQERGSDYNIKPMAGAVSPRDTVTAGLDFELPTDLDLLSHFSCSDSRGSPVGGPRD